MIQRINELAKKKKTVGLSPDELAEQAALRRSYLDNIKTQLKSTLEQIEFVEEEPSGAKKPKASSSSLSN